MREDLKPRIRRYGIPVSLGLTVTGVAMLLPKVPPSVLISFYLIAAVALALKLGWRSGMTVIIFAFIMLLTVFGTGVSGRALAAFLLLGLVAIGASEIWRGGDRIWPGLASIAPGVFFRTVYQRKVKDAVGERLAALQRARDEFVQLLRRLQAPRLEEDAHVEHGEGEHLARRQGHDTADQRVEVERAEREELLRELEEELLPLQREAAELLAAERREPERVERALDEVADQLAQQEAKRVAGELVADERLAGERQDQERLAGEGQDLRESPRQEVERPFEARLAALESATEEFARLLAENREHPKLETETEISARVATERAKLKAIYDEQMSAERGEREEILRNLEEERHVAQREAAEGLAAERRERERLERKLDEVADQLEQREAKRLADQPVAGERLAGERQDVESSFGARLAALESATEDVARLLAKNREHAKLETGTETSERVATERANLKAIHDEQMSAERGRREEILCKLEEERHVAQREAAEGLAAERRERERLERKLDEVADQLEQREAKRLADQPVADERLAGERQDVESSFGARLAALESATEDVARLLAENREHAKLEPETEISERVAIERAKLKAIYDEQLRTARGGLQESRAAASKAPQPASERGILSTAVEWLRTPLSGRRTVNLNTRRVNGNTVTRRRPSIAALPERPRSPAVPQRAERPRVLMLERRRGTADVVASPLRGLGVDVQIVERWIDAVDELFRFNPDAIFVDAEFPDFASVHKSIVEHEPLLPIIITASGQAGLPDVARATSVIRPYDADGIAKLVREAKAAPERFRNRPHLRIGTAPPAVQSLALPAPSTPAETPVPSEEAAAERYDVQCFNCRMVFDATEAGWCACLINERTFVCGNCLTCFCKAPASYKNEFWINAPSRLFERRAKEVRKQETPRIQNPPPEQVTRPLVLLVDDSESIRTIVRRVTANLGYGFVSAINGREGLDCARLYKPDLILADALLSKLDGREMCRILKEEAEIPGCKMIVMTDLYTDPKYKYEALKRFHLDDYLSQPVTVTDLVSLLQKHLGRLAREVPSDAQLIVPNGLDLSL